MSGHQFGLLLVVVALVTMPIHGAALGQDVAPSSDADQNHVATDSPPDGTNGFASQDQSNETNATFEPTQITDARASLGSAHLHVESGLLTLRNGTLTLFVKRGTLSAPATDAVVTNLRVVVGNRISPAEASRVRETLQSGDVTDLSVPDGARNVQILYGVAAVESDGETVYRDADLQATFGEPTRLAQGNATAGPETPFEVTNFSAPDNVSVEESFTVNATVTNPGTEPGVESIHYVFAGIVVQREVVELDPGESRTITFDVDAGDTGVESGRYTHAVKAFDSTRLAEIRLVAGGQNASE